MEPTRNPFTKNSDERRARSMKVGLVAFLAFLIVLAGTIGFLRRPEFQISDVEVAGTKAIGQSDVAAVAAQYLKGNYALVVPRTNALLLSKSGLEKRLAEQLPGITGSSVEFSRRNVILITVIEKEPAYVWCRLSGECYFLDAEGRAYDEAPTFSPGVYVTFTGGDIAADSDPLRQQILPAASFARVKEFLGHMAEYPVHVIGYDITEAGEHVVRFDSIKGVPVSRTARILASGGMDSATVVQALDLVMNEERFKAELAKNGRNLDYVDVRFAGKIYYKFANGVSEEKHPEAAEGEPSKKEPQ